MNPSEPTGQQPEGDTPEKLWPVLGEPDWERISKIAKPSETIKFGGVLRGCWSEGEMVGYATCMIEQVKPLKQFIELNHNELLSALISKLQAENAQLRAEVEKLREALQVIIDMELPLTINNALSMQRIAKTALNGKH